MNQIKDYIEDVQGKYKGVKAQKKVVSMQIMPAKIKRLKTYS